MKFNIATVCLVISLCITLVTAQIFGGHNSLSGDFGGPSAFSGLPAGSGRDPRQNRGPVVFPPAPTDAIEESSGVVIGGSGFGFVPPQSQKYRMRLKDLGIFKPQTVTLKGTHVPKKKPKKKYVLIPGTVTPRPGYKFVLIHPNELKKYL